MRRFYFLLIIAFALSASCGDDVQGDKSAATSPDGAVEAGQDASSAADASSEPSDAGDNTSGSGSMSKPPDRPTTPTMTSDDDGDGYPAPEDCDDSDPMVHPEAAESCNGKDEDCDGAIDENAADTKTFYRDADKDGYGTSMKKMGCTAPEGYADKPGDCDDGAAGVHPGAPEQCDFSIDDDCDGKIDEDAENAKTYYQDADGDGWGDPAKTIRTCEFDPPTGYVRDVAMSDCDDGSGTRGPNMPELCNNIDDDCDGKIDEGAANRKDYFLDTDGDSYGDPAQKISSCDAPAAGSGPGGRSYVENGDDCDDSSATVKPGAVDLPDDANKDSNCDGVDGDRATSIFVAAPDSGCSCLNMGQGAGTAAYPYCSFEYAVQRVAGRTTFLLSTGTHVAGEILRPGVSIYGGYDCKDGWKRSTNKPPDSTNPSNEPTKYSVIKTRKGSSTVGLLLTLDQATTNAVVLLDRLAIEGPAVGSGEGSTGLSVKGAANMRARITLNATVVRGGVGGAGANGTAGMLRQCNQDQSFQQTLYSQCAGTSGPGASGSPPESGVGLIDPANPNQPAPARTAPATAGGGGGGSSYCGGICGVLDLQGVTPGGRGGLGAIGLDATQTASASLDVWGRIQQDSLSVWSATAAQSGLPGLHGGGGAQGGQGGMKQVTGCIPACDPSLLSGGLGGGGGRNGCGGGGGTAGRPGGPSIALYSTNASINFIGASRLDPGKGGAGGGGGAGAPGGSGSPGLGGGDGQSCQGRNAAIGGPGGDGGRGGNGGGGSGGNGGASICWGRDGVSSLTGNGSPINATAVCPSVPNNLTGAPGSGGAAAGPAVSGAAGKPGPAAVEHQY